MNKPYVICHMGSTVDGRIIGERWGENSTRYGSLYEQCHNTYNSQAWMVGRVTMEKDFAQGRKPELLMSENPISRKPFFGDKNATSYAIVADPHGKLGWDENQINGDHVVEILSELVSDEYLNYLQNKNISYIFAGKENLDFAVAIQQLHDLFGVKTLMLEGGGNINGSLFKAGLIDEISLLLLPIVDGTANSPTVFDIIESPAGNSIKKLNLIDVFKMEHDVLWLKYKLL